MAPRHIDCVDYASRWPEGEWWYLHQRLHPADARAPTHVPPLHVWRTRRGGGDAPRSVASVGATARPLVAPVSCVYACASQSQFWPQHIRDDRAFVTLLAVHCRSANVRTAGSARPSTRVTVRCAQGHATRLHGRCTDEATHG